MEDGTPPLVLRWLVTAIAVASIFAAGWINTHTLETPAQHTTTGTPRITTSVQEPIVAFHDTNRGYTLAANCANTPTHAPSHQADDCRYRLWVTADGGQTWRGYATPVSATNPDVRPTLIPLGGRGVAIELGKYRWLSFDNGRQWRRDEPHETMLAKAPSGSMNTFRCADNECHVEVLLLDGTAATLAARPALTSGTTQWTPIHAGTLATVGVDARGSQRVAVSTDAGREWRLLSTPELRNPRAVVPVASNRLLVLDGETLVAINTAGQIVQTITTGETAPAITTLTAGGGTILGRDANNQPYIASVTNPHPRDVAGGAAAEDALTVPIRRQPAVILSWHPLSLNAVS